MNPRPPACKAGALPAELHPLATYIMDKKDFENLSESELRELKESIDEVLEEKKYKESYLKTNPRGVAIAWIIIAVILSIYRYITT